MNEQVRIPHSGRLEKSVLSVLVGNEYVQGEEGLMEELFFTSVNKRIFKMVMSQQRPLDLVLFTQNLINKGEVDEAGGAAYITEIYTYQPTSGHFKQHCHELRQLYARREGYKAAQGFASACLDVNNVEFIQAAQKPFTEVLDIACNSQKSREKRDIIQDLTENLHALCAGKKSAMGYSTGLKCLDESMQGINTQRIYVIGGYPSGGKTVLAVQILWALAMNNVPTMLMSLEMPDHKISERNLIIASGQPAKAVTDPLGYANEQGKSKPTKQDLVALKKGLDLLQNKPIHWESGTGASISQIEAVIRKNVRLNGVKAVGVDYVQLIKGGAKASKEQEIASISHRFQALAKELDIAILLLSQLNKEGATKYAQVIEEDADHVLKIVQNLDQNSEEYKKHLGIGVGKDRHNGNSGQFLPIILDLEYLTFKQKDI